jgi:hypothetical protein
MIVFWGELCLHLCNPFLPSPTPTLPLNRNGSSNERGQTGGGMDDQTIVVSTGVWIYVVTVVGLVISCNTDPWRVPGVGFACGWMMMGVESLCLSVSVCVATGGFRGNSPDWGERP